jgi:hypothetical protein
MLRAAASIGMVQIHTRCTCPATGKGLLGDVVLPAGIADDHAIDLGLPQDPNDLLFDKTFLHLASMYKTNMKTNYPAGYKLADQVRGFRMPSCVRRT